jgi:hypothetical protein
MLIIIPQSIEAHIHCSTQRESGFFFRQSSRNISAIIFGNCGTLGKFNRMGMLAGFGDEDISMHICGTYFNFDPNVTWPVLRIAEVKPDSYNETWGQGLSMYHNPNATYPVNANLFQNIRHHFYENGLIKSQICPGCDLISSKTITTIINHR